MKGIITDIKRFAVHDGDGIRTTVFLKGCPLKCVWCHNPEGLSYKPVLAFYGEKCTLCGECVRACPSGVHLIGDGVHTLERDRCVTCGVCADACFNEALKVYGKETDATDLAKILLEDKDFYETSGGGITLSGGECLMQPEFCAEILRIMKENGVHTAVDTCGYVPRRSIELVLPYTDIFLYDLKAIDSETHKKCTGKPNELILENLRYIDSCGKSIEIRYPYVPDFNDGEAEAIAKTVKALKNVTKVRVLPYHSYAGSKYDALSLENTLPERKPTDGEIKAAGELFGELYYRD